MTKQDSILERWFVIPTEFGNFTVKPNPDVPDETNSGEAGLYVEDVDDRLFFIPPEVIRPLRDALSEYVEARETQS